MGGGGLGQALGDTETNDHGWTFHPGIQFGEIYTDNIDLATAGKAKSDFITEVSPYLVLVGKSPRVQLNINYRMQNYVYAKTQGGDTTYHQLNANANAEVLKNFLYFNASGYMSQQLISPTGQVYLGNFTSSGNRTNVNTYVLSPYIRHAFGTTATTEVRYTRSNTSYSRAARVNSTGDSYFADIASGPSFNRLTWGASLSRQHVGYTEFPGVTFQTAIAQLGWRVGRSVTLQATGGYDKNDYVSLNPVNSGARWSVGLTWAPSPRTNLAFAYGRRYYGDNYQFQFRHSTRHTTWNASYSIDTTTTNGFQQSSTLVGLINPSGQINYVNLLFPTLQTQVYIIKNAQLSITRRLRAGDATISAYQLRRDYQSTAETTSTYGVRGGMSWNVSRKGTISVNGQWARYSSSFNSGRYDYLLGDVSYKHQMSRGVYGTLQYRRFVHLANGGGGYTEDIVAALINMEL